MLEKELSALENAEKKDKKSIANAKKGIEACTVTINRNERIEKELHEKYGDSYPQKIALSTGITTHFGRTAICLYGELEIFSETRSEQRTSLTG